MDLRSNILGETGNAQDVQQEFLNLFESMVRETNIQKSIEHFQLSIQEAEVKLDLAISPGTWLMSLNMVLNFEAKIACNNFLRHASPSMRLGLNSNVNKQIKTVRIRHNLGTSKIKILSQPNKVQPKESESKHHVTQKVSTVSKRPKILIKTGIKVPGTKGPK